MSGKEKSRGWSFVDGKLRRTANTIHDGLRQEEEGEEGKRAMDTRKSNGEGEGAKKGRGRWSLKAEGGRHDGQKITTIRTEV